MPAWKRTTMNGKFIELARKKAFQKKEEPKEIFYICPLAIIKSMTIAVNLQLKKDCGGGAILFKKRVIALKNAIVRKF